jgi:hypothetical protein
MSEERVMMMADLKVSKDKSRAYHGIVLVYDEISRAVVAPLMHRGVSQKRLQDQKDKSGPMHDPGSIMQSI